jgi:hypothetical protein
MIMCNVFCQEPESSIRLRDQASHSVTGLKNKIVKFQTKMEFIMIIFNA